MKRMISMLVVGMSFAALSASPLVQEAAEDRIPADGASPSSQVFEVDNELDFLIALGSDREIIISENVTLNLSRVLENEDNFRTANRRFINAYDGEHFLVEGRPAASNEQWIMSEKMFDGRQLTLVNISNLSIRGKHGAKIVVQPRYAFVFYLMGCRNVTIDNLVLGHTEDGYCEGGVIGTSNCENILISSCDLYGCGTYGIVASKTHQLTMTQSIIRDCSYGIMEVLDCNNINFMTCDFFRNERFELITSRWSENVNFTNCRIYGNHQTAPLFQLNNTIVLSGCEIHHPFEAVGTTNFVDADGRDNIWHDEFVEELPERGIGPH